MDISENTDEVLTRIEQLMKEQRGARPGDEIIVVMGSPVQERAETNMIKPFHRIN